MRHFSIYKTTHRPGAAPRVQRIASQLTGKQGLKAFAIIYEKAQQTDAESVRFTYSHIEAVYKSQTITWDLVATTGTKKELADDAEDTRQRLDRKLYANLQQPHAPVEFQTDPNQLEFCLG